MIVDRPDKWETAMAQEPTNPFGIPGLGQPFGTPGNNPLLASLEMMRHAVSSMGHPAGGGADAFTTPLTTEDLSRRISELKVVENWLKLNLSMLTSSIQGLEVQLATIQTLKSFAAMGNLSTGKSGPSASPLDVVLGLRTGGSNNTRSTPAPTPATAPTPPPETQVQSPTDKPTDKSTDTPNAADPAQAWWKMLENQFTQIAAATVAATQAQGLAMTKKTAKPATKPATKAATKAPAKRAVKRARKSPNPRSD